MCLCTHCMLWWAFIYVVCLFVCVYVRAGASVYVCVCLRLCTLARRQMVRAMLRAETVLKTWASLVLFSIAPQWAVLISIQHAHCDVSVKDTQHPLPLIQWNEPCMDTMFTAFFIFSPQNAPGVQSVLYADVHNPIGAVFNPFTSLIFNNNLWEPEWPHRWKIIPPNVNRNERNVNVYYDAAVIFNARAFVCLGTLAV